MGKQGLLTGSKVCLRRLSRRGCRQLAVNEVDVEWSGGDEANEGLGNDESDSKGLHSRLEEIRCAGREKT